MKAFRVVFGILAMLKAIDLAIIFPPVTDAAVAYPLLALWVAGALLLSVDRFPALGAAGVAVAGTAIEFIAPVLYQSHFYLIVVIAGILALFAQEHHRLLLRAQLSVVYGFAALTKINGTYLSGAVFESWLDRSLLFAGAAVPTGILLTLVVLSIACEAFLAVGLWFERTRVAAVAVGVIFHAGILLVLPHFTLFIYAGTMFALYWLFFDRSSDTTALPTWDGGRAGKKRAPLRATRTG